MFFVLSKIFGYVFLLANFLVGMGLVGAILLLTPFRRSGRRLMIASVALFAVCGFLPLGNLLLYPLESRFPAWDAARAGIGITVAFSYLIGETIESGGLVPLLQDFQPLPQPVSFVYSPNRFMPVKLRAFLDFTLPRLRARLAEAQKGVAARGRVKAS